MQLNELAELIFNYVLYGLVEGDIRELLLYEIVIELGLEHELVLLFLTKRVYVLFKHIIVNLQDLLDFVYIGVGWVIQLFLAVVPVELASVVIAEYEFFVDFLLRMHALVHELQQVRVLLKVYIQRNCDLIQLHVVYLVCFLHSLRLPLFLNRLQLLWLFQNYWVLNAVFELNGNLFFPFELPVGFSNSVDAFELV